MSLSVSNERCVAVSLFLAGACSLTTLALLAGCQPGPGVQDVNAPPLDLTRAGAHTAGAWTYTYDISSPGTRSEGYHGKLSYNQIELPDPLHVNDFYESPWGPLYWVGRPVVLFGAHGWMPQPVAREPVGRALIDPGMVHQDRYTVHVKLLAPEELATPDRLERDPAVLAALEAFGLTEVHAQSQWFALGPDPVTLHDTKRWGTLTVCRSDKHQKFGPVLEFTCNSDLTVATTPKPVTVAELMAPPALIDKPTQVSLCPQVDTRQAIQCTLAPIVGDPLVLYLVCRIQDQGAKQPWTVPGRRIWEKAPSAPVEDNQTSEKDKR